MSGRYLLDTNIVIDLFNGVKPVVSWLTDERIIFVPSIVVGELYFGVYKSMRSEKNIRILEDFIVAASVLDITTETAEYYGRIKAGLKKKGVPIPENDIWISSIAMQYDLALVTRDAHFDAVTGLLLERLPQ
ncbi:MAG TPA: type II toxin-antitoxin system VapC family toxin [Spirochaetota bacterium]|nr:type II toxin-antitoxin system VapC family toxin [Spirochaetota bacterium]HPQ54164.1 type II toxin-antitoxin system VapC family toxin [Spirochaetota bacterium]